MTKGRVGENNDRKCKTKGAETWGFMLFLIDVLEANAARLPPEAIALARAGRALEDMILIWRAADVRLTIDEIQRSFDAYKRFLRLTSDLGDEMSMLIPKRHVILHLLERLHDQGNPRFYANWYDETLNRHLKANCRAVSQITFEPSIYVRMRALLERLHSEKV